MIEFVIRSTNFGIDAESVLSEIVPADDGTALLTVEFEGRREDFDRIREEQDEEWGWATFPPSFYLRDFPIPWPKAATPKGALTKESEIISIRLERDAYLEYEVALYMMNHNTVEGTITIKDREYLEIVGQVDLFGKPTPFRIRWRLQL